MLRLDRSPHRKLQRRLACLVFLRSVWIENTKTQNTVTAVDRFQPKERNRTPPEAPPDPPSGESPARQLPQKLWTSVQPHVQPWFNIAYRGLLQAGAPRVRLEPAGILHMTQPRIDMRVLVVVYASSTCCGAARTRLEGGKKWPLNAVSWDSRAGLHTGSAAQLAKAPRVQLEPGGILHMARLCLDLQVLVVVYASSPCCGAARTRLEGGKKWPLNAAFTQFYAGSCHALARVLLSG